MQPASYEIESAVSIHDFDYDHCSHQEKENFACLSKGPHETFAVDSETQAVQYPADYTHQHGNSRLAYFGNAFKRNQKITENKYSYYKSRHITKLKMKGQI